MRVHDHGAACAACLGHCILYRRCTCTAEGVCVARADTRTTVRPSDQRACPALGRTLDTCHSTTAEVVHLNLGGDAWLHSAHLGLRRYSMVVNGSMTLSEGLIETAHELQRRGRWSLATRHFRLALGATARSRQHLQVDHARSDFLLQLEQQ